MKIPFGKWKQAIIFLCMSCMAMPIYAVTYDEVLIGNPGNADDVTGYGGVAYQYYMGKYEVTIQQYTDFLNAIAATDDHEVYNLEMANIANVAGILRTGSPGSYHYSVIDNDGSSANRPITSVSWFSAARFANWMANGQPSGLQTILTTEDGAYSLVGTDIDAVPKNLINPNTHATPTYSLPFENEWYKAAYYNPTLNGGAGGYYPYATGSFATPGNAIGSMPNQVNYISEATGYSVTQSPNYEVTQNYLTNVGSYTGSASYYGTYDQTGNVWEWNDLNGFPSPIRGIRGGAYTSTLSYLQSSYRIGYAAKRHNPNAGFRLMSPL